jgi:hypothetical protein
MCLRFVLTRKDKTMKPLQHLSLAVAALGLLLAPNHHASAQVSVNIGVQPVCPYGYYEVPPYNCAPDGYYGPEWFVGGAFIGAGPWFHGPEHFYGHVDHDFDYRKGYHGPFPARGDNPAGNRLQFRGKAVHDHRGREAPKNYK